LAIRIFKEKQIVMCDEEFFYLSNTSIPGNDVYYTSDKSTTPGDAKFKLKAKFEDKVLILAMVYQMPIFTNPRTQSIPKIYMDKFLKKRLLPFVRDMHPDNSYVFWLDSAPSHYARIRT
jgi:hypothetical protein